MSQFMATVSQLQWLQHSGRTDESCCHKTCAAHQCSKGLVSVPSRPLDQIWWDLMDRFSQKKCQKVTFSNDSLENLGSSGLPGLQRCWSSMYIYSIFCTHRRTLQARMLEWLGSFCAVRGCLLKHQETCRTSPLQITTSGLDMSIDMDPSHQWVEIIQLVFICWRWIAQEMEIPNYFCLLISGKLHHDRNMVTSQGNSGGTGAGNPFQNLPFLRSWNVSKWWCNMLRSGRLEWWGEVPLVDG